MHVLLLGATGLIGSAIVPELLNLGHSILALARTSEAQDGLQFKGVDVIRGDIRKPDAWSEVIHEVDAVIHVAATFTNDMGEVDKKLVQALIEAGEKNKHTIRFIYTGGVWLYGDTAGAIATEKHTFRPISSFAWMVENSRLLLQSRCFKINIIHPGLVYVKDGGAFSRFLPKDGCIEVWGAPETRWPLVHADDLAAAYSLVLERGVQGQAYNVCAEQGVQQGDIAAVISKRFGLQTSPIVRSVESLIAEFGQWSEGPCLDQQMSSEKIRASLGWKPRHTNVLAELA